ncbi:TRAFAC clade GTPase domain-containing protein [Corynebacterium aquilae]|uniref:TRAFAC clade GTPase domain-containing protein n=1 Tax=Corynebacterium aquilae TaxID=203263 RepID=UPI0009517757|nr:hypothetical protein [Corynebacterium aquilae]
MTNNDADKVAKRKPKRYEQHVAVFGLSGSGKTVLLSSLYGRNKDFSDGTDYKLNAMDNQVGGKLFQNYLGMRDLNSAPLATKFKKTSYSFALKPRLDDAELAGRFKPVTLVWHDYPGEWFTESPSGPEEESRRKQAFVDLLQSDVALLTIDAQKLLEHQGDEGKYLTFLFGQISEVLEGLKDQHLPDHGRLKHFPRVWVITLTKADLLPEMTATNLRDMVTLHAHESLGSLKTTLKSLVSEPDFLSIGEQFLITSSAKFTPETIDVEQHKGLEVLIPLACMGVLEAQRRWEDIRGQAFEFVHLLEDKTLMKAFAELAGVLFVAKGRGAKLLATGQAFNAVQVVAAKVVDKFKAPRANDEEDAKTVLSLLLRSFSRSLKEAENEGIYLNEGA